MNNPESNPFAKSTKKGKRKNRDLKTASLANSRRNARQLPTRQLNRGR